MLWTIYCLPIVHSILFSLYYLLPILPVSNPSPTLVPGYFVEYRSVPKNPNKFQLFLSKHLVFPTVLIF